MGAQLEWDLGNFKEMVLTPKSKPHAELHAKFNIKLSLDMEPYIIIYKKFCDHKVPVITWKGGYDINVIGPTCLIASYKDIS